MDTSSWRFRVLMEPRGFIRAIEVILAIVAFATTGGYYGVSHYTITCTKPQKTEQHLEVNIAYPFRLSSDEYHVKDCNGTSFPFHINGDFSPSAQWFVFVGVTAFLYSLASIVFYVVWDASIRLTHDRLVTIGDLAVTCLYTFFWLTAAASWAWGVGQVQAWTDHDHFFANGPLKDICKSDGVTCGDSVRAVFGSLTSSVAFAFLNFFLWGCNVWFVYKESPYHQEPAKTESGRDFVDTATPPNNM